jgi:hypothetical protein
MANNNNIINITFLVVEFEKEKGICALEVVPDNWRDTVGCRCILYPSHYSNERVLKAVKRGEVPTDMWKSYPIKREWFKTGKCSFSKA